MKLIDEAVYAKTGKHLNDLQRGIIEGTLKRQKYSEIAEGYNCTPGHAKDVGYELLQLLSDVFEEPVDKKNLKSVLERQDNLNISFGDSSRNVIGFINVCSDSSDSDPKNDCPQTQPDRQHNLTETEIEAIAKLRQFGLDSTQIAEALQLSLDEIEKLKSEEVS
ncbi:hypothetical protein [Zarconia navalis]|uniref:hypothetical protein n=1 Tax=Zarconia navalis TaxID=2992134 RepID=UPI0021F90BBF|nr:hypothetical protein [Zarconia navalis]